MKHSILISYFLIFFIWLQIHGQTISKNLSLAGFRDYNTLYNGQSITPASELTLADVAVWYDSRNGKEYALVCLPTPPSNSEPVSGIGSGVAVIEVTNPSIPIYRKTIQHPTSTSTNTPADVKVYNNIAFIGQNFQPTYWVELEDAVDNPGNATAGYGGDINTGTRVHNLFVNADHELLFTSPLNTTQKIKVYDISGLPGSAPVYEDEIDQLISGATSHDLYAYKTGTTTGLVFDASLRGVTVGEYSWSGGTFSITDQWVHQYNSHRGVSPSNFSGNVMPESDRKVHTIWVDESRNYMFTDEEQGGGSNSETYWINPSTNDYKRGNYLYAWDINPIKPSADANNYRYPFTKAYEVRENADDGNFATSNFSLLSSEKANSMHNIVTLGTGQEEWAYISYYTKGVRVLDVTNPANMSELAYYDVPGVSVYKYPVFNGAWGVDPFLPSGNIAISSSDGFYLFRKAGEFQGTIDVDTKWTSDVAINVSGDLMLASGSSLTINAGTQVKVAPGAKVTINGTLNIQGTSSNPVLFTSSEASPAAGDWDGFVIASRL